MSARQSRLHERLRSYAATAFIGLVAAAGAWGAANNPGWRDVLDTPARQSPLAAQALINGLASQGTRTLAVGQRGHILFSDDAGKSWRQAEVPVSSDLVAVSFADARNAWAVGHDGVVLHSGDAGQTWRVQYDGRATEQGDQNPWLDVWFASDAREGWVVGAFGQAMHTTDGGAHWTPMPGELDNPKGLHLYAMRQVGADLYIAGEQGLLLKRAAGDTRFRAIEVPYQGTLFGLAGNEQTLLAYGLRGTVLRSTDGGRSWKQSTTGVPAGLTAGTRTSDGRFVLVSQAGHVLA
ncbi:MAG: glycosyl hydrolase, partial [Proteobacteria bacterium]|nr:glycosyl hydrolase [Pseudomonadota bacterium]